MYPAHHETHSLISDTFSWSASLKRALVFLFAKAINMFTEMTASKVIVSFRHFVATVFEKHYQIDCRPCDYSTSNLPIQTPKRFL